MQPYRGKEKLISCQVAGLQAAVCSGKLYCRIHTSFEGTPEIAAADELLMWIMTADKKE